MIIKMERVSGEAFVKLMAFITSKENEVVGNLPDVGTKRSPPPTVPVVILKEARMSSGGDVFDAEYNVTLQTNDRIFCEWDSKETSPVNPKYLLDVYYILTANLP